MKIKISEQCLKELWSESILKVYQFSYGTFYTKLNNKYNVFWTKYFLQVYWWGKIYNSSSSTALIEHPITKIKITRETVVKVIYTQFVINTIYYWKSSLLFFIYILKTVRNYYSNILQIVSVVKIQIQKRNT